MGARPVTIIMVAEIVGITATLALIAAGSVVPVAVGAGLLTALGAVMPFRRRSLAGVAALRSRHLLQSRGRLAIAPPGPAMRSDGCDDAADAPDGGPRAGGRATGREEVTAGPGGARSLAVPPATGFRWDAAELVCAMQVSDPVGAVTTIASGRAPQRRGGTAAAVSPGLLAPFLEQFDIRLSGIDIHTRSVRTAGPAAAAAAHARLVGRLPATVRRDTIVVVRLDPRLCPAAVARRGGAVRAAGVAAARIVRAIDRAGLAATMLTAAELDGAVHRFTCDDGPGQPMPRWDHLLSGGAGDAAHRTHTVFALPIQAPVDGAHPWDGAWESPCAVSVLSVRVGRARSPGHARVGALVRYVSDAPTPAPRVPGARRLDGGQLDALRATCPRGDSRFDRLAEPAEIPLAAAHRLTIPVAGHGQLVGGDASGRAVLAALAGPWVRTMEVAGRPYLARQVVLRALATGARILVVTDRPGEWRHLEAEIAEPSALRVVAGTATGSGVTTGPAGALTPATMLRYGVIVADCLRASGPLPRVPADATVIRVAPLGTAGTADADAQVRQDPDDPNTLHILVHGTASTVSVVSIPDEARLIGRPQ
ncbi:type VII secretion protein EccE [Tomitella gaofuii]|uniref:type VII secretion protein EccE n=1 Tax=Tomitella gaofuii TaxID=2760083 RepID=UPI0015FBE997|nr:type VII secretion protein EccE [Tomitella gaofuii]